MLKSYVKLSTITFLEYAYVTIGNSEEYEHVTILVYFLFVALTVWQSFMKQNKPELQIGKLTSVGAGLGDFKAWRCSWSRPPETATKDHGL